MAKVVLTTKSDSIYDDLPEERYHFPRMYLNAINQAVGDWAVYYEPLRPNGRQVYFATVQIVDVRPDPKREGLYYAFVQDYMDFPIPVPLQHTSGFYESNLQTDAGDLNRGVIQRAVRLLPDADFELIVQAGCAPVVGVAENQLQSLRQALADEPEEFRRPIIERVNRRPIRDEAFKLAVRDAYDSTCAMTGLRIINGLGRPEAEAAHIKPVERLGPDSVRNGVALCSTVHWMFDRGLVSIADDYTILTAGRGIPDGILGLLNKEGRLKVPDSPVLRPHPQFLRFHREHVFEKSDHER